MTDEQPSSQACCYIKELPEQAQESSARSAVQIYLPNAPVLQFAQASIWSVPGALGVYNKKYWGPKPLILTVSFLESPPADLCAKILDNMNAWKCSIKFTQATAGTAGDVRISLAGKGYWSYLGTDILSVPLNHPTMNLEGFSIKTSDSEFHRVVRHETGHTLGFPHEQLRKEIVNRIDRKKAYAWFKAQYGWSKQMVDDNVLTPIDDGEMTGTASDATSIMCYHLPASIMNDGKAVLGGGDVNSTDLEFCHTIYPPSSAAPRRVADLQIPKATVSEDVWNSETNMAVQPSTCAM